MFHNVNKQDGYRPFKFIVLVASLIHKEPYMPTKSLQIRSSTAEFLIIDYSIDDVDRELAQLIRTKIISPAGLPEDIALQQY